MSSYIDQIEVPEDPCTDEEDDKRLWIGNLASEVTEFAVLKLMQKFGSLRKMDFIYHRSGPDEGKSKGYCFVSFHTWEAAEKARKSLDGKVSVAGRRLMVKWANRQRKDEVAVSNVRSAKATLTTTSALASTTQPGPAVAVASLASSTVEVESAKTTIKAIEAKLELMQQTQKDFGLHSTIQPPPGLKLPDAQSTRPAPYRRFHRPRNRR